MLFEFPEQLGV